MNLNRTPPVLGDMPPFRRVDAPRLRVIARRGEGATLTAGERPAEGGEPGDDAHAVSAGRSGIRIAAPAGEITAACLGRGEMARLTDRPRAAAMVAATDRVLRRLGRAARRGRSRHRPDVAPETIGVPARRGEATTARRARG